MASPLLPHSPSADEQLHNVIPWEVCVCVCVCVGAHMQNTRLNFESFPSVARF